MSFDAFVVLGQDGKGDIAGPAGLPAGLAKSPSPSGSSFCKSKSPFFLQNLARLRVSSGSALRSLSGVVGPFPSGVRSVHS